MLTLAGWLIPVSGGREKAHWYILWCVSLINLTWLLIFSTTGKALGGVFGGGTASFLSALSRTRHRGGCSGFAALGVTTGTAGAPWILSVLPLTPNCKSGDPATVPAFERALMKLAVPPPITPPNAFPAVAGHNPVRLNSGGKRNSGRTRAKADCRARPVDPARHRIQPATGIDCPCQGTMSGIPGR